MFIRFAMMGLMVSATATAQPESRFFDSDGVRIRYVDMGTGQPVVLLHGLARDIDFNWIKTGLAEDLAAKHRVIAFDCRGHGQSDKPQSENAYGRQMVEDLGRLLKHLEIDQAHFIGHSLGGRVALKFAALYPQQVRSVVLIGTGGQRTTDDHTLWEMLAESLRRGDGIAPLAWKMWPADRASPSEEQLEEINQQFLGSNDVHALACTARQFIEFATTPEEIGQIQAPMLAIIGSTDVFRTEIDSLRSLVPDLEVTLIENATFSSVFSRPELLASIEEFLAKVGGDAETTARPHDNLPPP